MKHLILIILMMLPGTIYANEPEEVLEQYFQVLTSTDYSPLKELIAESNLAELKELVNKAIRYQTSRGVDSMERRFFDRPMSSEQLDNTPAEHYLEVLAAEILRAANNMHFSVGNQVIIGKVIESDDVAYIVARVEMRQDGKTSNDAQLYSLVRENGAWKLTFPPTFKQILTMLEASYKRI